MSSTRVWLRSPSPIRSRSRSPERDTDEVGYYYTGDVCRDCTRRQRMMEQLIATNQLLAKSVDEQKVIIHNQRKQISHLTAKQFHADDGLVQEVVHVLRLFNTKLGLHHVIPWGDQLAVNIPYTLILCRTLYNKSWFQRTLIRILKTTLHSKTCGKHEKLLLPIAPIQCTHTTVFIPLDIFQDACAKYQDVPTKFHCDVTTALKTITQLQPQKMKLRYEQTNTQLSIGQPLTGEQLQNLWSLSPVCKAFGPDTCTPAHYKWCTRTNQLTQDF